LKFQDGNTRIGERSRMEVHILSTSMMEVPGYETVLEWEKAPGSKFKMLNSYRMRGSSRMEVHDVKHFQGGTSGCAEDSRWK
jgi:hypothetical protein